MISNKVKGFRVMNGDLTQQDLADRIGCSRQTIHSIESGKFVPSVELALKLATTLGVKVEDLFSIDSGAEAGSLKLFPKKGKGHA